MSADTWGLVEKFNVIEINGPSTNSKAEWRVWFNDLSEVASAPTPTLAICRAFLSMEETK